MDELQPKPTGKFAERKKPCPFVIYAPLIYKSQINLKLTAPASQLAIFPYIILSETCCQTGGSGVHCPY